MRTVYLKQVTFSTIAFLAVAIIGLAGVRTMVTGEIPGDRGAGLFQEHGCDRCHYTDTDQARIGPGLAGLFEQETLPVSEKPVTEENVREQLVDPYRRMPSYEGDLTDEEINAIIDYLKTL